VHEHLPAEADKSAEGPEVSQSLGQTSAGGAHLHHLCQSWNAGFCCRAARAAGVDDLAFIKKVVRRALAQPDADQQRVYLVGYSNGGRMALRVACAAPRLFTAVAVYGAVGAAPCPNRAPVSLLIAAGTADPELTLGLGGTPKTVNGYTEPTVRAQAAAYVTADACHTPVTRTEAAVETTRWTNCTSGAHLQLSLFEGATHAWPPALPRLIWTFLRGP
jgi:polyhydroxybutyrate depolymerase